MEGTEGFYMDRSWLSLPPSPLGNVDVWINQLTADGIHVAEDDSGASRVYDAWWAKFTSVVFYM